MVVLDANNKFRFLEVVPVGREKKVLVKYYDVVSKELFVKEEECFHVTPSFELNIGKYGFTRDSLLSELSARFEGDFEIRRYGKLAKSSSQYDDSSFYRENKTTFVVWHKGNRCDKDSLEFFLDDAQKKQIFVRNPKLFKARTRVLSEEKLSKGLDFVVNDLFKKGVDAKVSLNERKSFIEVVCKNRDLKILDSSFFRINVYESGVVKRERDAELILEDLKELPGFDTHVDIASVVCSRRGFDFSYSVKITVDKNKEFLSKLGALNFRPVLEKNKQVLKAREILWDPLGLNSSTKQLRDFFPLHSFYDPSKPLVDQINLLKFPFTFYDREFKNNRVSALERAIDGAFNFYLKNSVVVDLEVTDYSKGVPGSGRVFMAVLNSSSENKIYMTKEAWLDVKYKSFFSSNCSVDLVFVDEEVDLFASLYRDVKKYRYVIGHNFKEYDHKHLVKFNGSLVSLKREGFSVGVLDKIKSYKKEFGGKVWGFNLKDILDTKDYVNNRLHLLENYKLATFAGSSKSIGYDEMKFLLKSKEPHNILKIIDYTVGDGDKNKVISDMLLRNAAIEVFAANKPINSVFSLHPTKIFYDANLRSYFVRLRTYKNRHEYGFSDSFDKLSSRRSPDELVSLLLKDTKQVLGSVEGYLCYSSVFVDALLPSILNNPVMKFIYNSIKGEDNLLVKSDLIYKLNSFLLVQADKVKNFMNAVGLEFGKVYDIGDVFHSLDKDDDSYFSLLRNGFSDFELSRMNFIFCAEYNFPRCVERVNAVPYDYAMLEVNNLVAKNILSFKEKILAKSKSGYVLSEPSGFNMGFVRAINFKDQGLICELGDYKLYFNRRAPRDPLIKGLVDDFFNGFSSSDLKKKYEVSILSRGSSFAKENSAFIRAFTGINFKYGGGSLSLDF